jgi:hypothetical protein
MFRLGKPLLVRGTDRNATYNHAIAWLGAGLTFVVPIAIVVGSLYLAAWTKQAHQDYFDPLLGLAGAFVSALVGLRLLLPVWLALLLAFVVALPVLASISFVAGVTLGCGWGLGCL